MTLAVLLDAMNGVMTDTVQGAEHGIGLGQQGSQSMSTLLIQIETGTHQTVMKPIFDIPEFPAPKTGQAAADPRLS